MGNYVNRNVLHTRILKTEYAFVVQKRSETGRRSCS